VLVLTDCINRPYQPTVSTALNSDQVLLLPGWLNSGPGHWQSLWQSTHGYSRVDQHDWARPLRGDWITRLEDVVTGQKGDLPITLVAHSLGCLLVAAWAALSRNTARVKCAFLVAPCDIGTAALQPALASWKPLRTPETPGTTGTTASQTLPFPSLLLASRTDPYCRFEQAHVMAANWGSTLVDCGERGHINADSGLHDWPAGHDLLRALQRGEPTPGGFTL
jgi:uncharacterized protein